MQALLEKIAALYGIPVSDSADKIAKGFLSENHMLTAGSQRYFLKKYRFVDPEKIRRIHNVKSFFAKGGIPIIMPLPAKDGVSFFAHESALYALFPFVSGRQFEAGQLTTMAVGSLGRMLGSMHLLGKDSKLAVDTIFRPWNRSVSLERADLLLSKVRAAHDHDDFDRLALETLTMKKAFIENCLVQYENFHFTNEYLLHGDYHGGNVFFDDRDEVSHVFDFEKSGHGPRFDEVFRSMTYTLIGDGQESDLLAKAKTYMDAYRSVCPMSSEEIAAGLQAFYVKIMHGLWVESEHYLSGNARVDVLLQSERARLKFLSEHITELTSLLTR